MATQTTARPLLLLPQPPRPTGPGITLPDTKTNLFHRLIRDPTAPKRASRERPCAEMFCGVLINAPATRRVVLEWLAKMAGVSANQFEDLDWTFDTEQAIGSKRDDLRIQAHVHAEGDSKRVFLWSMEVKVAAPLHQSSPESFDDEDEIEDEDESSHEETDTQTVSQITNYDHWLAQQQADHRAGFVLAMTDQRKNLPADLQMQWHCATWTELALVIEDALAEERIPAYELVLARHMCGFIRDYLWKEVDMSTSRFDFDDLALMRAFALIGRDCFDKVHDLVRGIEPVLLDSMQGCYLSSGHFKGLKSSSNRSAIYVKFLPEVRKGPISPSLYAGIMGGEACVFLESSPPSPAKAQIRKLVQRFGPLLRERNANWEVFDDDSRWSDLVLSKSLDWILADDDQQAALNAFVAGAIVDLKEVGLIDSLVEELELDKAE